MNYIAEYCTCNDNLSVHDVQDTLEEIMDQEFEAVCDDNSISGKFSFFYIVSSIHVSNKIFSF